MCIRDRARGTGGSEAGPLWGANSLRGRPRLRSRCCPRGDAGAAIGCQPPGRQKLRTHESKWDDGTR
eukprot:5804617-Prorocentrum_lima.AAC.1